MARPEGERPLRSYGRRKGHKLSPRQQRLMDELLPELRLDLTAPCPEPVAGCFPGAPARIWLEIGFGAGEHLLWQAQAHPDMGVIGCEPFINGVAKLLGHVQRLALANVRIHDGDARDLLAWLPDAALDRVFLLFPDPWPKKRHHKRRLVSPETLAALARVMAPGSELRFASDIADYVGAALLAAQRTPEFAWTGERPRDWRERPADWPETRYERKALGEGRTPYYLTFMRR